MTMPKTNRPHFHLWAKARQPDGKPGRMLYRLARSFHTRQAARQWGKRHYAARETTVLQCSDPRCGPKLV